MTFSDPEVEAAFGRDGFVLLDGLDRTALRVLAAELGPLIREVVPLFSLYRGDDVDLRCRLDAIVRPALTELLGASFVGQRFFLGSTLVKFPDPEGSLDLHQDWSFVDEPHHVAGLVWVPLDDVEADDGALRVVAGSHRLPIYQRGLPVEPVPLEPARTLLEDRATVVPCPFGSAIAYDHRLVHGSCPNVGTKPRIAAVMAFAPVGAALRHRCVGPEGEPLWLTVDDHFFEHYDPGTGLPEAFVLGAEPGAARPAPVDASTARDVLRSPRGGLIRRWFRR